MNLAVYSGTFNPLHIGHLAIMEALSERADVDWTLLMISAQNPFKGEEGRLTARDRYKAALEALHRHPSLKVWVDDSELRMPPPSYTIRTLDHLREIMPGCDFTLVIGADNLEKFRSWKEYQRILTDYGIMVYPREGTDHGREIGKLLSEDPSFKIQVLDCPKVDISSTYIREALSRGEDVSRFLM